MTIGERLKFLRLQKNLSQGEIEKRSGLLRCYISRVEHGYTVPTIETVEKFARALQVPLYQLFYEGSAPPVPASILKRKAAEETLWGSSPGDARMLEQFRLLFSRMSERNLQVVLSMAQKMAISKHD